MNRVICVDDNVNKTGWDNAEAEIMERYSSATGSKESSVCSGKIEILTEVANMAAGRKRAESNAAEMN